MRRIADPDLHQLLGRLSLDRKVLLLTGRDLWSTWPLPEIGLSSIVFSDGPSGVRGVSWDERDPSLSLPSGTALAATWDRDVARRYGAALAVEAQRKHVHVVLGPTINLHRSPLGGRHFEAFSEDPLLTGVLAMAYVEGLQQNGIAATPKHYVANEAETDRFTADSRVSDRALRELYLRAFERPVAQSQSWAVMSAYNSINGVTASENDLLTTPLRTDWGFDGVVVSDWTAVRSIAAANADQDLAMPGPIGAWGEQLVAAVRDGRVAEALIDIKVLRILTLASRVGALTGFEPSVVVPFIEDGPTLAREVESAAIVLVKNDGLLPLPDVEGLRIAVIGHNATFARTTGGGSATVIPEYVISPLDGIVEAYPLATIEYSLGAVVQDGIVGFPLAHMTNPATGGAGVHVSFLSESGGEIFVEERFSAELIWLGSVAPVAQTAALTLDTIWTPRSTGEVQFGVATCGTVNIDVDGQPFWETTLEPAGEDLAQALLAPRSAARNLFVEAGRPYRIAIRLERKLAAAGLDQAMSFIFGLASDRADDFSLIEQAEVAARNADVVVLVVGTNSEVESEGFDRKNLSLPGQQDLLAQRVLAANPRTVVVVNSGAPVLLPWRDRAAAILFTWFGGQEYGHSLADVLKGDSEPGGRLPTTWPAALEDVPVIDVSPHGGVVVYEEGIHLGYKAWMRARTAPAWPFGFGLGYTTWRLDSIVAPSFFDADSTFSVQVRLTNTGDRFGKQVVQLYASKPKSDIERPATWLIGFVTVTAPAGAAATVEVHVSSESFAHWMDGRWNYETGPFAIAAGFNVEDCPLQEVIRLRSTILS